jgi:flagellar motility protein MotE (MotC chaperone)
MVRTLREVADLQRATNSRLADIVSSMASSVEDVEELPPAAASQHLYALESSLLARCLEALEPGDRDRIEHQARVSAASAGATDDARTRAFRAHRDRLLRELLGLPRLEL